MGFIYVAREQTMAISKNSFDPRRSFFRPILVALILIQSTHVGLAQQTPQDASASSDSSANRDDHGSQISSEQVLTFTKRVNLVLVPVVVRNKDGKAVGSLKREDFQIFDDGKLQSLNTFSIESSRAEGDRQGPIPGNIPSDKAPAATPTHFFAYLFDDMHLGAGDLMQVRLAARKHMESGMGLDDRAAVFTTSGNVSVEFTNDKSQLTQAMDRIKPTFNNSGAHCPYMNYHLAQKIVEESGGSSITPAWDGATLDAWNCIYSNAINLRDNARRAALDAARREVQVGDTDTRQTLLAVQGIVRHLAAMPGARTLILISPGFQTGDNHLEQNSAIDLATARNIVINAIDASGLSTGAPGADSGSGPSTQQAAQFEDPINREAFLLRTNVMAELAEGTGGKFFRDNNDLLGGFSQLATPPEFVYMLGFKPEELKKGGRYHHLKVKLARQRGLEVQARNGYYESAGSDDPQKLISDELQEALFSREEMHNIPIRLQTGYARKEGTSRELSITTHLDTNQIHFRKVDGKNLDNLTVVCGLFDLNGNYLQGKKQEISMHMDDEVLNQVTAGMNIKTTFRIEPGAYMIRVVVRDAGDEALSAVNASGFIP